MSIPNFLLVGAGGCLGSMARYGLSGWVHRLLGAPLLPFGTIAVNILGCFAIGLLAGLAETRQALTAEARIFLLIGVLGGFTTFSTFGYETLMLARDGEFGAALANVGLQVIVGLAAVWLGLALARLA